MDELTENEKAIEGLWQWNLCLLVPHEEAVERSSEQEYGGDVDETSRQNGADGADRNRALGVGQIARTVAPGHDTCTALNVIETKHDLVSLRSALHSNSISHPDFLYSRRVPSTSSSTFNRPHCAHHSSTFDSVVEEILRKIKFRSVTSLSWKVSVNRNEFFVRRTLAPHYLRNVLERSQEFFNEQYEVNMTSISTFVEKKNPCEIFRGELLITVPWFMCIFKNQV